VYYSAQYNCPAGKICFSLRMIPLVGSLQKHGEEFLPLASVDSIREESYDGKKRDFSLRTIVLGTVVSLLMRCCGWWLLGY
jgi:hypothetical protein